MVWGVFSGYDKCPLVIVPLDRRIATNFVDIVYKKALFDFYFLHDHPNDMILM